MYKRAVVREGITVLRIMIHLIVFTTDVIHPLCPVPLFSASGYYAHSRA
jgi:hypothetical protein